MKFWEVIQQLTIDPKKRFVFHNGSKIYTISTNESGGSNYFHLTAENKEGRDISHFASGGFDGNLTTEDDWQLVRQPVTWQEAIQAWADGKTIRLIMPEWEQVWVPTNNVGFNHCHINQGKWYVE